MRGISQGFILIELLVVVLIIGILAAVALPQYQLAVDKSRYTELITLTNSIAKTSEVYYLANGTYPTVFSQLDIDVPAQSSAGKVATFSWGTCYLDDSAITCLNNNLLKNGYEIYYKNADRSLAGEKICFANTTEAGSRFDKVCANLGKLYNPEASCYGGACRIYKLR